MGQFKPWLRLTMRNINRLVYLVSSNNAHAGFTAFNHLLAYKGFLICFWRHYHTCASLGKYYQWIISCQLRYLPFTNAVIIKQASKQTNNTPEMFHSDFHLKSLVSWLYKEKFYPVILAVMIAVQSSGAYQKEKICMWEKITQTWVPDITHIGVILLTLLIRCPGIRSQDQLLDRSLQRERGREWDGVYSQNLMK